MKVLILHQHFNIPEKGGSLRSYYLAKALVSKGIDTVVITTHNEKHFKKVDVEGIEVHYLPIVYENRFGFIDRSSSFLKYVWGVVNHASLVKDVNLCYAISVPLTVGLAAIWLKFKYKIPFIFEVGDLWPDAPIQMGFIKNAVFKSLLFQLEKSIYNQATSVVALSSSICKIIEQRTSGKKIHLIPNMSDVDFYKPGIKDQAIEKKYNLEGKFVISYIGALGLANGLDYFLECARASEHAKLPIHFILCGKGAMKENLKKSAARLGLQNILFVPFQTREGVREIMNVTDATFVCYKSLPILETGSPNKYFDGLSAGKLIIINFGGWIKAEIEMHQCGIQVDSKQPTDFVSKIIPFLSGTMLNDYSTRSRELALNKYSRKLLGEKFVSVIEST